MTQVVWDALEERTYETGCDRGVFYPDAGAGVPWNGLISVDEAPTGGEAESYFYDGVKYLDVVKSEDYQARLTAYMYPDEFGECDGTQEAEPGLFVTLQPRKTFGLSYRTLIGNADNPDLGYKIHLVYNVLASPTTKSYRTLTGSVDPTNLSWSLNAVPISVPGHKPTAHFIIDTTKVTSGYISALEEILYGTADDAPRLPTWDELVALFQSIYLRIIEHIDTGLDELLPLDDPDLFGSTEAGLYSIAPGTRLTETDIYGLYEME